MLHLLIDVQALQACGLDLFTIGCTPQVSPTVIDIQALSGLWCGIQFFLGIINLNLSLNLNLNLNLSLNLNLNLNPKNAS